MTGTSRAAAKDYLTRLGLDEERARQVLDRCPTHQPRTIACLQEQIADDPETASVDAAWLRWCLRRAYLLPLPDPERPLMPAMLPLRRQQMKPRPMQRGIGRRLLAFWLYRPAANALRHLQLLTGRVDRP